MKVYIVQDIEDDDRYIGDIYASKERAEQARDTSIKQQWEFDTRKYEKDIQARADKVENYIKRWKEEGNEKFIQIAEELVPKVYTRNPGSLEEYLSKRQGWYRIDEYEVIE